MAGLRKALSNLRLHSKLSPELVKLDIHGRITVVFHCTSEICQEKPQENQNLNPL